MGRRSRKRAARRATTRAERDAARRARPARRPSGEERPPAPWGNFPLSELLVLAGIALMAWGVFSDWRDGGVLRFGAGLGLASLAGVELALREHLAGFRSHTTLLAGAAAFLVVTVLALGPGPNRLWALTAIALVVFGAMFWALRELFKRRSGGVSFR